jgi:hypothetical protein
MGTTLPENQQQIADNLYTVTRILEKKGIPMFSKGELFWAQSGKTDFFPGMMMSE